MATLKRYTVRWSSNVSTMTSYSSYEVGETVTSKYFFGLGGVKDTGIVISRQYKKNSKWINF